MDIVTIIKTNHIVYSEKPYFYAHTCISCHYMKI